MIPISKKNKIIAGVAAAALLIVVFIVLVSRKGTDPGELLNRCAGRSDSIEGIKISSCPNISDVGYCEIEVDSDTQLEVHFTPCK